MAVFETSFTRFGVVGARFAARRHGEVLLGARRRGQEAWGRVAKFSSVRVGVGEGAKRGEVCSPAICEVFFGAWRRARARRRTIFSPAWCSARVGVGEGAGARGLAVRRRGEVSFGASRAGRRRCGLQVHSPALWRCVSRRVSARAKARMLAALYINSGRPGALLDSSLVFGPGCG